MPHGLPEKAVQKLMAVLSDDPRIHHVCLFGSRALGTQRVASDIDLCIEAPAMQLQDVFALEHMIDELSLPWKVDVVLKHMIDNPDLISHIQRIGIPLMDKASAVLQPSEH